MPRPDIHNYDLKYQQTEHQVSNSEISDRNKALILGYRDILASRAFRWLFPLFALMSYVYAWGTLPINTCREDIYSHLLWHLGLWKEYVP